jgi:hypothetical protein
MGGRESLSKNIALVVCPFLCHKSHYKNYSPNKYYK